MGETSGWSGPSWNPYPDHLLAAARRSRAGRFGRIRSFFSIAFPWQLARVFFAERHLYPVDDVRTTWVERIRSLFGAVIVLGAIVRYDPQALLRYPTDTINALNNAALVAIAVVIGVCAVTTVLVRHDVRRQAVRSMLRPIVSVALLLGSVAVFHVLGIATLGTPERPLPGSISWPVPDMAGGAEQFGLVLLMFLRNFLALWALIFLAVSIYLVAASVFAIGDAHPRLAPVASIVLTTTLLGLEWIDTRLVPLGFLLEVSDPLFPPEVALALQGGGTLLVVALALVAFGDLGRLRRGQWRLRQGPWL